MDVTDVRTETSVAGAKLMSELLLYTQSNPTERPRPTYDYNTILILQYDF